MVIVLYVGELLIEHTHVVVVDQGYRAHHLAIRRLPRPFHQLVANQIAERLAAVGVSTLADETVELIKEPGVYRYPDPAEAAHGFDSSTV